jgi:hypothetical protein
MTGPVRLPAHVEVSGLLRTVSAAGGFATVLAKGERDAGTVIVVCCHNGMNQTAYERMPSADGQRTWRVAQAEDRDDPFKLSEYLKNRKRQDPDLWIVELDIPDAERFIDSSGTPN